MTSRKIRLALATILSILIVVILTPFFVLVFGPDARVERTLYERAMSPDGWHEARVQFDDAGAVSSFSRLVLVKHHWNHSDAPLLSCRAFWAEGEEPVHLRWLNDDTLLITHGFAASDVRAVADHCGPVRIVVRPKGPNAPN